MIFLSAAVAGRSFGAFRHATFSTCATPQATAFTLVISRLEKP